MAECSGCTRLRQQLDAALLDAENLEVDLRVMRRRLRNAENQLKQQRKEDKLDTEIHDVFAYWVARCSKDRERTILGEKRYKAVHGRLKEGHTVDDLKEAIDGAAVDAYVSEKGIRYDDLELICRDEVKVQAFRKRAQIAASRLTPKQTIEKLRAVAGEPIFDRAMEEFMFRCPACRHDWDDQLYRPLRVVVNEKVKVYCLACDVNEQTLGEALRCDADGVKPKHSERSRSNPRSGGSSPSEMHAATPSVRAA